MKFYFFDYCISVLLILFHKRGSRVSLLNFYTILFKDLPKFFGSNKEILLQPQLFSIVNSTKKTKQHCSLNPSAFPCISMKYLRIYTPSCTPVSQSKTPIYCAPIYHNSSIYRTSKYSSNAQELFELPSGWTGNLLQITLLYSVASIMLQGQNAHAITYRP